jgi:hypothetical protein
MKRILTLAVGCVLGVLGYGAVQASGPGLVLHREIHLGFGAVDLLAICDEANGVMVYVARAKGGVSAVPGGCAKAGR